MPSTPRRRTAARSRPTNGTNDELSSASRTQAPVSTWRAPLLSTNRATSVDLPIPASPQTSTLVGSPATARR